MGKKATRDKKEKAEWRGVEVATQALDVEEKDNFGLLWFWKKTQFLEREMW